MLTPLGNLSCAPVSSLQRGVVTRVGMLVIFTASCSGAMKELGWKMLSSLPTMIGSGVGL